jgi:hypothetical protein
MTEYLFRIIDSYTPRNIPMARLAEYMAEFAKLLGETQQVHFDQIVDASVGMGAIVEPPAQPAVALRLQLIDTKNAAEDALRASRRIDDMLAADDATGELLADGAQIIQFPGKTRHTPQAFGPFTEDGTLDGEIVRIGGTDDTIHVTLRDGRKIYSACVATIDVAKQLAPYLLGPYVRLHGTGRWLRLGDGTWELKHFRIRSFDVLQGSSLQEIVARLQAVPGSHWPDVDDPVGQIARDRSDDGTLH